jgi:hypothetical protein
MPGPFTNHANVAAGVSPASEHGHPAVRQTKMNISSTKMNTCGGGGCSFSQGRDVAPPASVDDPSFRFVTFCKNWPGSVLSVASCKRSRSKIVKIGELADFQPDSTSLYQVLTQNQNRRTPIFLEDDPRVFALQFRGWKTPWRPQTRGLP